MTRPRWRERDEAPVSYLKEMITHPTSIYGLLGAVIAGAVLSIPLGLGIGAVPLLGYAALEGVAALFIPSSPVFRAAVDRKRREERRRASEKHLLQEIAQREGNLPGPRQAWERMRDRLASLQNVAVQREILGPTELETLDDATVDYLGLWLSRLVMRERRQSVDATELERRRAHLERQREAAPTGEDRRRADKAINDLTQVLDRHRGLRTRESSVEAAMISMADTFEEVYQRVMTQPTSGAASRDLHDAVERLRMEERLDEAVDVELDDLLNRGARVEARLPEPPEPRRPSRQEQ